MQVSTLRRTTGCAGWNSRSCPRRSAARSGGWSCGRPRRAGLSARHRSFATTTSTGRRIRDGHPAPKALLMAAVNFSLDGEVALVTGAASGIGRAIAQATAASGAAVGLVDLTEDASEETAEEISGAGGRAVSIAAD